MQIRCPDCDTSYEVTPASLGAEGRKVRCIRCERVWFAAPQSAETMAAADAGPAKMPDEFNPPAESAFESNRKATTEADNVAHSENPASEPAMSDPVYGGTSVDDQASSAHLAADAEPVAMADSPSIVPPDEQDPPLAAAAAPLESHSHRDIRSMVARRAQRILARSGQRSGLPGQIAVVLALVATIAGLLIWRKDVVRFAPQTASLYASLGMPVNLRGLTFANIKTLREMHDGTPVLVVEGEIVSAVAQTVEVPRLRFAVRNAKGQEVYSWTALAGRSILAPGDSMEFRSRLASPPTDGSDVVVRFFNRRDVVTHIR